MTKVTRLIYLAGSGLWALFALLSLVIMFQMIGGNGSEFDFLQFVTGGLRFPRTGILLGVGHVIGFVAASLVCLAVSAWLFVKGTIKE